MHAFDRRTAGRTMLIVRPRLHSMQRGKNYKQLSYRRETALQGGYYTTKIKLETFDVLTSFRGLHQKKLVLSSSGSSCQQSGRMPG